MEVQEDEKIFDAKLKLEFVQLISVIKVKNSLHVIFKMSDNLLIINYFTYSAIIFLTFIK